MTSIRNLIHSSSDDRERSETNLRLIEFVARAMEGELFIQGMDRLANDLADEKAKCRERYLTELTDMQGQYLAKMLKAWQEYRHRIELLDIPEDSETETGG